MERVAIIGAGMTGLTAAYYLSVQGLDVQVFDKGRARGGRIATRRTTAGLFDHGAPHLDVNTPRFDAFLSDLGVAPNDTAVRSSPAGMRSVFDHFDGDARLRQEIRITGIKREASGWILKETPSRSFSHFDYLLLTIPAPQAYDLVQDVDSDLALKLQRVRMLPVWTCMVSFRTPLPEIDIPQFGPILRADSMTAKSGLYDSRNGWVIHMTPAFSKEHLHADPAMIAPAILETLANECTVALPHVEFLTAHRWRYAFADRPLGTPFLVSSVPGLLVGGDWTLGAKAEHGFESGSAMAQTVLSSIVAPV